MQLTSWVLIIGICIILMLSMISYIRGGKTSANSERHFSTEIFYTLFIVYLTIIIGFGLIYFILSMNHILLVENSELRETSILGTLAKSLYFSGVTLLTIGYGDITPIGLGRFLAVLQALIGYILPTAFVLRLVQSNRDNREEQ